MNARAPFSGADDPRLPHDLETGRAAIGARTRKELHVALFDTAEAETLDRLFNAQDHHDDAAAIWAAWGTACGVLHYFRQARGDRGVGQLLQALDRVATAGLDRTTFADLRADAS